MVEKIYNINEVCEILKVSKQTIFRMIKAGTLPAVKLGQRYRFKETDIQKIIDTGAPPTYQ